MTSLPQVLLTLAFLMNRCRTQSPPVVRHDAYDHRVIVIREGETAQLQCPVDHSFERNYFDWYKDSEPLNTDYGRLSISDSTGSLRITEASVQDSGHYTCKAINGFGSVDVNVTLIVRGTEPIESSRDNHHPGSVDRGHSKKPSFVHLTKLHHPVIQRPVGSSVKFKCEASGAPDPTVYWLRNREALNRGHMNRESKQSKWGLHLQNLRVQDTATYTCVVTNEHGSINASFPLEVIGRARGKPEHMSLHPENTTVMAGETVAFQCIVRSEAKPTMKWLKQVPESEVHHQEQTVIRLGEEIFRMLSSTETVAQSEGLFTNRLVIARTRDSDAGRYVCWAGNIDDFNFLSAHLSIIPTPSISTTPVIIIISLVALFLLLTIVVSICLCRHCRAEEERSSTAPQVPDKKTTSSTAYSPPPPPALPPLLAAANCKLLPPHPATMMSNQQWRFSHTPSANGSRHYHTQRHLHYVC
ncbi:fibroblast growth factor receptor-like 1 isoform X2 [Ornithodoros turicata]|uniref:fibroblast growth factor receptor-like 1 isoform X2 n=1 Tax=Ornithodoros turicata TaxID=34597 RepID=UPI0031394CDE